MENQKKQDDAGRSMVETLGVLAIMGVLSVGGVAGYNTAMNRHRANEVIAEANKRAAVAAAAILNGTEGDISLAQFNGEGPVAGASFDNVATHEDGLIKIKVRNLPRKIYTLIKAAVGTNSFMQVSDCEPSGNDSCSTLFFFDETLSKAISSGAVWGGSGRPGSASASVAPYLYYCNFNGNICDDGGCISGCNVSCVPGEYFAYNPCPSSGPSASPVWRCQYYDNPRLMTDQFGDYLTCNPSYTCSPYRTYIGYDNQQATDYLCGKPSSGVSSGPSYVYWVCSGGERVDLYVDHNYDNYAYCDPGYTCSPGVSYAVSQWYDAKTYLCQTTSPVWACNYYHNPQLMTDQFGNQVTCNPGYVCTNGPTYVGAGAQATDYLCHPSSGVSSGPSSSPYWYCYGGDSVWNGDNSEPSHGCGPGYTCAVGANHWANFGLEAVSALCQPVTYLYRCIGNNRVEQAGYPTYTTCSPDRYCEEGARGNTMTEVCKYKPNWYCDPYDYDNKVLRNNKGDSTSCNNGYICPAYTGTYLAVNANDARNALCRPETSSEPSSGTSSYPQWYCNHYLVDDQAKGQLGNNQLSTAWCNYGYACVYSGYYTGDQYNATNAMCSQIGIAGRPGASQAPSQAAYSTYRCDGGDLVRDKDNYSRTYACRAGYVCAGNGPVNARGPSDAAAQMCYYTGAAATQATARLPASARPSQQPSYLAMSSFSTANEDLSPWWLA